jgi:hypothetical protein
VVSQLIPFLYFFFPWKRSPPLYFHSTCHSARLKCYNITFLVVCVSSSFKSILQGLHPGPAAFFRFVAFLFLAIVAAESQCLIVAALLPVFIAALAISAL